MQMILSLMICPGLTTELQPMRRRCVKPERAMSLLTQPSK
jgi:hypothetical protein